MEIYMCGTRETQGERVENASLVYVERKKTRMREKREASARKTRDVWLRGERVKNLRGKQSDPMKGEKELNNLPLIDPKHATRVTVLLF